MRDIDGNRQSVLVKGGEVDLYLVDLAGGYGDRAREAQEKGRNQSCHHRKSTSCRSFVASLSL